MFDFISTFIPQTIFYETSHNRLQYEWLCTCKIIFYLVKVYTLLQNLQGITFWHTLYA